MKQTNISNLKAHLSRYLAYVRQGGTVRVYDRDRPVADLVPLGARIETGEALDELLTKLERRGIVRSGETVEADKILEERLPVSGASVLDALLEERRNAR